MMPAGISECRTCGVPIAADGGGICEGCAFYLSLTSRRLARWLKRHRLVFASNLVWRWVFWRLDGWRATQRLEAQP